MSFTKRSRSRSSFSSVSSFRSVDSLASTIDGSSHTYLAKVWTKPEPHELWLHDKGKHGMKISCQQPSIASWWLGTIKASFPQDTIKEEGRYIRLRPDNGVILKLDMKYGCLKIKGDNHYEWYLDNIEEVLTGGGIEVTVFADTLACLIEKQLGIYALTAGSLIEKLPKSGAVQNGVGSIYALWKTLLDKWMGLGAHVTIVTPTIDPERLADIILLMIKNEREGFTLQLITQDKCDGDNNFRHTKIVAKELLQKMKASKKRKLLSHEKMDWAWKHMEVRFGVFNCRFIGMYVPQRAELMVTSAAFHRRHFYNDLKDTVSFQKLSTAEYRSQYLEPLGFEPKTSV